MTTVGCPKWLCWGWQEGASSALKPTRNQPKNRGPRTVNMTRVVKDYVLGLNKDEETNLRPGISNIFWWWVGMTQLGLKGR